MTEELTQNQAAIIVADAIHKGLPITGEQRKKDAEYAEKLKLSGIAFEKQKKFAEWQEKNRDKN